MCARFKPQGEGEGAGEGGREVGRRFNFAQPGHGQLTARASPLASQAD